MKEFAAYQAVKHIKNIFGKGLHDKILLKFGRYDSEEAIRIFSLADNILKDYRI